MSSTPSFPMPAKRSAGSGPRTRSQRRDVRNRQRIAENLPPVVTGQRPKKVKRVVPEPEYSLEAACGPTLVVGINQLRQRAEKSRTPRRNLAAKD